MSVCLSLCLSLSLSLSAMRVCKDFCVYGILAFLIFMFRAYDGLIVSIKKKKKKKTEADWIFDSPPAVDRPNDFWMSAHPV